VASEDTTMDVGERRAAVDAVAAESSIFPMPRA